MLPGLRLHFTPSSIVGSIPRFILQRIYLELRFSFGMIERLTPTEREEEEKGARAGTPMLVDATTSWSRLHTTYAPVFYCDGFML